MCRVLPVIRMWSFRYSLELIVLETLTDSLKQALFLRLGAVRTRYFIRKTEIWNRNFFLKMLCVSITRQRLLKNSLGDEYAGKNRRIAVSTTIEELLGYDFLNMFPVRGPCRRCIGDNEGRLQTPVEREVAWRCLGGQDWSWAVIINSNRQEAAINPIIKSRTHYHQSRLPRIRVILVLRSLKRNTL